MCLSNLWGTETYFPLQATDLNYQVDVLIEPMRNWNLLWVFRQRLTSLVDVLIEPMRNWNFWEREQDYKEHWVDVLIEPMRNWNLIIRLMLRTACLGWCAYRTYEELKLSLDLLQNNQEDCVDVLIEPMRNWNSQQVAVSYLSGNWSWCAYRTYEELKLVLIYHLWHC